MVELGTATNLENFGLSVGTPDIASVGPLAFRAARDVLFIADNVGANIFAVDVADSDDGPPQDVNVDNIDASSGLVSGLLAGRRGYS